MNLTRIASAACVLLRVVSGLLFFQSGAPIILGWFGGMPDGQASPPPLPSQTGLGGMPELVGGLCILLGLCTRPVAFVLSGEMAVAYWQFHAPNGRWPAQNQGLPAVLLCFSFLFIAAQGSGGFSLDALLRRRRDTPAG
jgi:putative oxidoreductase